MAKNEWQGPFNQLRSEMQSLDAKIRVVAQRMRVIEKNEQIIGKTLVNHNKKLKTLEMSGGSSPQPIISSVPSEDLSELTRQIDGVNSIIKDLVKEINRNRELVDKMREDVNEMKYILDTVNPMAYVTADQVSDLVDEKLRKKG